MKKTRLTVAKEFVKAMQAQFPEIQREMSRTVSPDDHKHIWIRLYAPMDDDRQEEFSRISAEMEMDILLEYGYRISLFPYQEEMEFA